MSSAALRITENKNVDLEHRTQINDVERSARSDGVDDPLRIKVKTRRKSLFQERRITLAEIGHDIDVLGGSRNAMGLLSSTFNDVASISRTAIEWKRMPEIEHWARFGD